MQCNAMRSSMTPTVYVDVALGGSGRRRRKAPWSACPDGVGAMSFKQGFINRRLGGPEPSQS